MEEFTKQMAHSSMSVLTKVVRRSCELSQSKSFCELPTDSLCSLRKSRQKLEGKARKSPRVGRAGVSNGCDFNTVIPKHVFTLVLDLLPHSLTHAGCSMTPNVCSRTDVRVK